MDCEAARAQLADRLSGDQPPAVSAALDEHLRTCEACARDAAGLADTWALLGDIPAATVDSAAMRARFDAALRQADAGGRSTRSPLDRGGRSGSWFAPTLQTAAAVLLLAGGFIAGRTSVAAPAPDPAIGELRQELRATREAVSLSLMQQESASDRLRGVSSTSQIDQPGSEVVNALLDTLLHDPDVNVRTRTVDALRRFAERSSVRRAAAQALTEPRSAPLLQIALIDFLAETRDRDAVPSLQRVSEDAMVDKAVRARAAAALAHIG
jgi:hypothetical protein